MKISPLATVRSAVMNSPESYYLHLAGAQQGPYTIPQIDHLLNSGLIAVETLYWCEGLDQWQPVTTLVPLRKKPRRWVKPLIAVILLVALAVPATLFGPILVVGWHEANQHSYTPSAAYWRARDVVRSELRKQSILVDFAPLSVTQVALHSPKAAEVHLGGSTVDPHGTSTPAIWNVAMQYDPEAREWSGQMIAVPVAPAAPVAP